MHKIKNTLIKFGAVKAIMILLCVVLVAIVFWNQWNQSTTNENVGSATKKLTAQTKRGLTSINTSPTNLATISSTRTKSKAGLPVKTNLAAVTAAENQTYTTGNRLFVTGNDGIFEIVGNTKGSATIIQRAPKQDCAFGGIVEVSGVLYANCYEFTASHIYAAKIDASPSFKRVYSLKGTLLANGLTADDSGRLYMACTFNGKILRLTPSAENPLEITRVGTWLGQSGLFTNGIKYANGSIYWTNGPAVKRATLNADGSPGNQKTLLNALAYFDDLAVDNTGMAVADYTAGAIRSYDLNGNNTGTIATGLNGPSSVQQARAPFPVGSLIVTQRGGNQVTLVTP